MQKIKGFINKLAASTGYKVVKNDTTERSYREHLAKFIENYSSQIKGDVLDAGAGLWTWPKERFAGKVNFTTLDNRAGLGVDIVGDVLELSKATTKKFDVIFCFEVLEHVKNPHNAVQEMTASLKSGGLLLASTPFSEPLHGEEYGDYWRITRQGWAELLKDFKDVKIQWLGEELKPHHYMVKAIKR